MFFRPWTGLFLLFCVFFLNACNSGTKEREYNEEQEQPLVKAPDFNADSAYAYIQKQVDFGPRIPNTEAHENCARWLEEELSARMDSVTVQRTTVKMMETPYRCINIIGHINSEAKDRILLLAHWDTRPFADGEEQTKDQTFDGADDGASGVGVLLEIARQLQANKQDLGIDILFTDVEDAGVNNVSDSWALGTQYWANLAKKQGYKAKYGILLDMVGGKRANFFREQITLKYANAPSKMVWDLANRIGYSDFFRYGTPGGVAITDDHEFVNRIVGIPTMDIIGLQGNGNFMPWHHTLNDNMDIIDKKTLKAVGQTVLQVIYSDLSF